MDLALDLNALYATKEAGAYPLMLATYEIVCSKGYDADTAAAVKSFLTVSANQGQAKLSAGRATSRCPTHSRSVCSSPSTQLPSCLAQRHQRGEDGFWNR